MEIAPVAHMVVNTFCQSEWDVMNVKPGYDPERATTLSLQVQVFSWAVGRRADYTQGKNLIGVFGTLLGEHLNVVDEALSITAMRPQVRPILAAYLLIEP